LRLEGLRFRYYSCPRCGYDDVFLDLIPLPGETMEECERRRRELAEALARRRFEQAAVVVTVPAARTRREIDDGRGGPSPSTN
jgi:hypothetical protein